MKEGNALTSLARGKEKGNKEMDMREKEAIFKRKHRNEKREREKGNMRRENGMVSRLSPGRNRASPPFPVVSGDEAGIVERDVPRRGRWGGRGLLGWAWERRLLDWCTRKTERKEYREKEGG